MKTTNQKLKLLYLAKILLEKTDEEHTMTVQNMISELKKFNISAERKSIYDDLENLRLFGLDICSRKTKTTDYFIAEREFELPELKLLVDSVQASKFITHKKSMELISKIEKLTSRANAKKLHRQVFVTNRVKTLNEQIYYNVDIIHDAIADDRKITFQYFDYDLDKKKVYRKNGERYMESPVALTWDDENYYMITYKEKYNNYTHYRVDKMEHIEPCDERRMLPDTKFDLSSYVKATFQMFSGTEKDVSILFDNSLVGVVYDRFGVNIPMSKKGDNHFLCRVKVAVSPQFLSWVMSFGDKAKIVSPMDVVEEMQLLLAKISDQYK